MRLAALCASPVIALAFVSVAGAKGPVTMEICGPSACQTLHAEVGGGSPIDEILDTEPASLDAFVPSPPPAPYYEAAFKEEWVTAWKGPYGVYLVPSAGLVYDSPNWIALTPRAASQLRSAVSGLRPFAAPSITRVVVGGRAAADPAAYAGIFGRLERVDHRPADVARLRLHLHSARPTPWTQDAGLIEVAPGLDLVQRDNQWFRLPRALADVVRPDAGLVRAPAPAPPSFPWAPVLGGAAALGAALMVTLRRRKRDPLAAQ